ncbi:response regulator transcription factor [Streptomyces sp. NPDC059762]|uniref:response regulator transcription factor n=1 Tax=Streptomyces sp. NPDC059762 TaxID=3346938 RepID=UPI00365C2197
MHEAVREMLTAAARARPLVLLLDDIHLADAWSVRALARMRSELDAAGVVTVATVTIDALATLDTAGVRILELAPLTAAEATMLLRARHPELVPGVRDRVIAEAGGNPLALTELPARLTPCQRAGAAPLPDHLPPGRRTDRMLAHRVRGLPAEQSFTLLLCALAGRDGRPAHLVLDAARAAGVARAGEHLVAAVAAGLLAADPATGRLRFRPPLLGAWMALHSPAADQRRAHRAWVRILPDRDPLKGGHAAAASPEPDERVARALDRMSRWAGRSRGESEAARLLARGAALSPDPAARAWRIARAAWLAALGGDHGLAASLIEEAGDTVRAGRAGATLDLARALLALRTEGDPRLALALMPGVLTGLSPSGEPWLRASAVLLLLAAAVGTGAPEAWRTATAHATGMPEVVRLFHDVWSDPPTRAAGGATRLDRTVRELTRHQVMECAPALVWTALALDAVDDHRELWELMLAHASTSVRLCATLALVRDDYLRGHWDRSVERARRGAAEAAAAGLVLDERLLRCEEGRVWAARGRQDRVAELLAAVQPWAVAGGHRHVLSALMAVRTACALAGGDHEAAYDHARAPLPGGIRPDPVVRLAGTLDLVDAAARSGREGEARDRVRAARARGMADISPRHAFVLAAAEALVAPRDAVGPACERAVALGGADAWPFELARVRLHHGAWLRRQGRRAQARCELLAARETFTRLGATPWARRAEEELKVGEEGRAGSPPGTGPGLLTYQELRVARLVAEGLPNREIGLRLRLSPRTVASHLYRIYPKLGVERRGAVAQALRAGGSLRSERPAGSGTSAPPPSRRGHMT